MLFRTFLTSLKSRPRVAPVRRPRGWTTTWLRVETLEDRSLPSGLVTLAVNDDSILVGERVTWTAAATDVGAAPVYQFSAATHGGTFHVLRDYSPANTFTWTPMREGDYDIRVIVKTIAELEAMVEAGQIETGHTLIGCYWLLRHRDRLRRGWLGR